MTTEQDIIRKYKRLIDSEEDDGEKLRLEMEQNREIAALYRGEASAARVDALKKEAINKYPRALLAEVEGETAEELEESAKKSHERVLAIIEEAVKDKEEELAKAREELAAAQAAGWKGNTASGSGPSSKTQEQERDDAIDTAWAGLRNGTLTREQGERLIKERTGGVVAEKMTQASERR
jgi:hypothetical protein